MPASHSPAALLDTVVVTAEQMRQIESRLFAAGMPVAALMEKVALRLAQRVMARWPRATMPRVGVLVGPGHNGGDALVVARELHNQGYRVQICCPLPDQLKPLTDQHAQYCRHLGLPFAPTVAALADCDGLVDGLFGFGLTRSLTGPLADLVQQVNQWPQPILSLDVPSGLHTDTGQALGTAVQATHTFCLGLWKVGLLQDHALAFVGTAERVDFDIPAADVTAILGPAPPVQRITPTAAIAQLPIPRPLATHKYRIGHGLVVCGSRRYAGGAVLTGLGAQASGVGMLTLAVPQSLKPLLTTQIPDALVVGCPETAGGAIAELPPELDLGTYDAIAIGPGLTPEPQGLLPPLLACDRPLVLDADGLNRLAALSTDALRQRSAPTILTPHLGEFRRLFPHLGDNLDCRITAAQQAAAASGAVVLLKGARVAIAAPNAPTWLNPDSTPALARGGSGDVLTGLLEGLLAQRWVGLAPDLSQAMQNQHAQQVALAAAWWHAQAGRQAARDRTELGVDAATLSRYLGPTLAAWTQSHPGAGSAAAAAT